MVLNASAVSRGPLQAARFVVLVLASLLVAHTAVFLAQYGAGAGFANAMSEGGHDGYWLGWVAFVASAAVVVGTLTGASLVAARLDARTIRPHPRPVQDAPARTYWAEFRHLWPRLFFAVALGFVIQENVEHAVTAGHFVGLWALGGPEYPLALPALLAVSFGVAALGAFVRWRVSALLRRRPRSTSTMVRRGLAADRPTAQWAVTAALCHQGWILARELPGRAPPVSTIA